MVWFKIYIGGVPTILGSGMITLGGVRTGNRPLTPTEIATNLRQLRTKGKFSADSSVILAAEFKGEVITSRGYGPSQLEKATQSQAARDTAKPTPVPSLDPLFGPHVQPGSWIVSDANWKVSTQPNPGESWKRGDFDDTSWAAAITKPSPLEKKYSLAYAYNDKPLHLASSSAHWIGFATGRAGFLRRSFVLSPNDQMLLTKEPGTFYITASEKFDCYVNGRWVGTNGPHYRPGYGGNPPVITYWQVPQTLNIAPLLHAGKNVIAVELRHDAKASTDERQGMFADWQKGPFNDVHVDWSALPGGELIRPATLDLREIALRSMEYHFNTDFKTALVEKGGVFYGWSYGDTLGRALDAVVLLRTMTGVDRFKDADRRLMEVTFQTFTHPDGLSYRELAVQVPPELAIPGSIPYACMWDQGEVLFGLVTWYEKTRSPIVQGYLEGLIHGLSKNALKKGDAYHIPEELWDGRQWVDTEPWFNPGAVLLDPIAHYYEISKSPAAYDLLRGLYQSQKEHLGRDNHVEHYFDEKFRLQTLKISGEGQDSENFGGGITLGWLGVLRSALVLKDSQMVEWITRAFDWAMGNAATRYGHALEGLGYLPGEICGASDMVETATLLAENQDTKYWDFVEQFIRNHILQTQDSNSGMWGRVTPEGAMSAPLPCCSSRGARAIYIAWHHTVSKRPDGVYVNLEFNRDSPWVEVISYLPYQGRIDLNIHDAPVLYVRIPRWVTHDEVRIENHGKPCKLSGWQGDYAKLEAPEPGQHVSIQFPMRERETIEQVRLSLDRPPVQFKVHWRGYTVISVNPAGKYNRSALLAANAPMRKVKSYYQPSQEIDW